MQLATTKFAKYQQIGIKVLASDTRTKIPFDNVPSQLRNVALLGLTFPYVGADQLQNPAINDNGPFGEASYLTLHFKGGDYIQTIPIRELVNATRTDIYNVNGILCFNGQVIDWYKSFITLGTPFAWPSDSVILFGVYFA